MVNPFHSRNAFGKRLLTALVGLLLLLVLDSVSFAKPFRLAKLPDKGAHFGCGTCHVNPKGGGPRNSFGKDWEKIAMKAGDQYTESLGKLDSDGDGATNDQEFDAGTNPGDARSTP